MVTFGSLIRFPRVAGSSKILIHFLKKYLKKCCKFKVTHLLQRHTSINKERIITCRLYLTKPLSSVVIIIVKVGSSSSIHPSIHPSCGALTCVNDLWLRVVFWNRIRVCSQYLYFVPDACRLPKI